MQALPQVYAVPPCETTDQQAVLAYLRTNVGRILQPMQWNPGHGVSMLSNIAKQVLIWRHHRYPRWLIGVRVRWDYVGAAMVPIKPEHVAWVEETPATMNPNYPWPGMEWEPTSRQWVWPTNLKEWRQERADAFKFLVGLRRAEGLVPLPRGANGLALDPRSAWGEAADRVGDLLEVTEARWLVHAGNKTPHFHSGGTPGQGFAMIPTWSREELYDSIAAFYRKVQARVPNVRICKIEMRDPHSPEDQSQWVVNRGLEGIWNHGPLEEYGDVAWNLGP